MYINRRFLAQTSSGGPSRNRGGKRHVADPVVGAGLRPVRATRGKNQNESRGPIRRVANRPPATSLRKYAKARKRPQHRRASRGRKRGLDGRRVTRLWPAMQA